MANNSPRENHAIFLDNLRKYGRDRQTTGKNKIIMGAK
jgi:hypothetical protein